MYAYRLMSLKVYGPTVVQAYRSTGSQAYGTVGLRS